MYFSEHMMGLRIHWKLNLLSSWAEFILTSFCNVRNGCRFLLKVVPCPLPSSFNKTIDSYIFMYLTEFSKTFTINMNFFNKQQQKNQYMSF